jgi:hypothetical protein
VAKDIGIDMVSDDWNGFILTKVEIYEEAFPTVYYTQD